MFAFAFTFFGMFVFAILVASGIALARGYQVRVRCYRRKAIRSLVATAKRNAIRSHYGNV